MAVQKPVRLDERYRRQCVIAHRRIEFCSVLDVRGSLCRIPHDRGCVGLEIADVAVGRADRVSRVRRAVGEIDGGIVGASVIGPGDALVIERVTDRPNTTRRDRTSSSDALRIDSAVGNPGFVLFSM